MAFASPYQDEHAPKPQAWHIQPRFVYVAVFLSGLAALLYELLWVRILHIMFGVSSFSVATVFGVFLLGIGIGSVLFGKKSETSENPLKLYAWIEIGIAVVSSIAFIIAYHTPVLDTVLSFTYNNFSFYLQSLARLVVTAVILLPPTIAMGGTIPVISKYFIRHERTLGSRFSTLYYLNTLGSFAGALLTGLLLVNILGITYSWALAVLINGVIGIGILLWHSQADKGPAPVPIQNHESARNRPVRSMLLVLFLTGFITLAFEIVWIRVLTNFGSGTTLASSLILGGFLIGFVVGSVYIARIIDRLKNLAWHLSLYAVLSGTVGAFILFVFGNLNHFLAQQFFSYLTLLTEAWIGFALSFMIAIVLGTLFPLAVRVYAGNQKSIGKKTGMAYIANMIGAICGSIFTGFVLIPFVGIKLSVIILVSLCLVLGIIIFFKTAHKKTLLVYGGTALTITACFVVFSGNTFFRSPADDILLWYEEGVAATVTVHESSMGTYTYKYLNVDSQTVAGTYPTGIIDAKILAHIPILLTASPQRVATVGYGTGITTYSMSLYDADVTALEIEQQVINAAISEFSTYNHRADTRQNVSIVIDDARNYLQMTDAQYDTIVTDVTNLKYKNNPYLYTTDYFRTIQRRLTKTGVAAAWVPLGGLSENDLKILAKSFQSVFPHTTMWYYAYEPTGFLVFVGTPERLVVDIDALAQKIKPVANDLEHIGIANEYMVAAMLLLGERDVADFAADAPLHTDDRPILEYTDLDVYATANPLQNLEALVSTQKEILKPYYSFTPEQEQDLLNALGTSRALINHYLLEHQ